MELRAALVGGALAAASAACRLWLPLFFRVLSGGGANTNSSSFSVAGANAGASPRLFQDNLRSGLLNAEAAEVSQRGALSPPSLPTHLPPRLLRPGTVLRVGSVKRCVASPNPTHLAAARTADHLTCARWAVAVNHQLFSWLDPEAFGFNDAPANPVSPGASVWFSEPAPWSSWSDLPF